MNKVEVSNLTMDEVIVRMYDRVHTLFLQNGNSDKSFPDLEPLKQTIKKSNVSGQALRQVLIVGIHAENYHTPRLALAQSFNTSLKVVSNILTYHYVRMWQQYRKEYHSFVECLPLEVPVIKHPNLTREMYDVINTELEHISDCSEIAIKNICGPERYAEIVLARILFIKRIKELYPRITLDTIGVLTGDRDHATIINSLSLHDDMFTSFRDKDRNAQKYRQWYKKRKEH